MLPEFCSGLAALGPLGAVRMDGCREGKEESGSTALSGSWERVRGRRGRSRPLSVSLPGMRPRGRFKISPPRGRKADLASVSQVCLQNCTLTQNLARVATTHQSSWGFNPLCLCAERLKIPQMTQKTKKSISCQFLML